MSDVSKRPTTQVDMITRVAVTISVMSLAALVISYIDHLLFYSYFGIPVNSYIQVSEAVVLFLPRFISYVVGIIQALLLCVIFGIFLFFPVDKEKKKSDNKEAKGDASEDKVNHRKDKKAIIHIIKRFSINIKLLNKSYRHGHLEKIIWFMITIPYNILAIIFELIPMVMGFVFFIY